MALSKPSLSHQTLPLLPLFVALLFLMLANKVHSQQTVFLIYKFTPNPADRNVIYQGDAHLPRGWSGGPLSLTRTEGGSFGRVVYSSPVHFWDRAASRQSSFLSSITFSYTPANQDTNAADGIAFFIAPFNSSIPCSTGGNLGLFGPAGNSSTPLFAVEFDPYINTDWDPSFHHIGININSRNSTKVTRLDITPGLLISATIVYTPRNRRISVIASSNAGRSFTVEHDFDLKTILPEWVQVGISASTGQFAANHQLSSWIFSSAQEPDRTDVEEYNKSENEDAPSQQYV